MTSALLTSSCGTQVYNIRFYHEIPGANGVASDSFLTSSPITLNETQWEQTQLQWASQGIATSCIPSTDVGRIKKMIEHLCSTAPWYAPCIYEKTK
jgi:hypothetical protein